MARAKKTVRMSTGRAPRQQMPPARPTRSAAAAASSASSARQAKETNESLSSFVYYRQDTTQLAVDVRMGSLLTEHCDAIAFSVDPSLSFKTKLGQKIAKKIGSSVAFKNARSHAKTHPLAPGHVVGVDCRDNENGWKSVFMVVMPTEENLQAAYKDMLKCIKDLGLKSFAVVGLGCGQIGMSAKISATKFMDALISFDATQEFTTLEQISIVDVQRGVVSGFVSRFNEYVEDHHHFRENRSKLVCVDNHNIVEYEARRITTKIAPEKVEEDVDCVICLDLLKGEQEVCSLKCGHHFHFDCFKSYLKQCTTRKCCPVCRKYFAVPCGNQPKDSRMWIRPINDVVAGHEETSTRTLEITYSIPSGTQDETHLRPGVAFRGTNRVAYLPDSEEGRKVLRLLKKAFECRLTFTVGDSVTTGVHNVVTWNCIHHKTNLTGGPAHFGFPDPTYFVRVLAELEEAGITEDLLDETGQEEAPHPNIYDNR